VAGQRLIDSVRNGITINPGAMAGAMDAELAAEWCRAVSGARRSYPDRNVDASCVVSLRDQFAKIRAGP